MKKSLKEKIKKITIDKIAYFIIVITIILLNIQIGSNIKEPIWLIQMIVSIFATIFIIYKKIKKRKNIIIKGKIDIAVLILMISTILPLIFNTYNTLSGTINFILKYWSIFGLYILVRNEIKEEKEIKHILNVILISSIIPIILGFDKLTFNIFESLLDLINAVKIEDTRMISTFGYANTFAAYLGMTLSVAIATLVNSKSKKSKILYSIYILIACLALMLTQSKLVFAIIFIIIVILLIKAIREKKISSKKLFIGAIVIVTVIIYVIIASGISKPAQINESDKFFVIRGVNSDTDYKYTFDMSAQSDKDYDIFTISIVEITRFFSEKTLATEHFSEFQGEKNIDFHTTKDDILQIEVRIKNNLNKKITINNFKINNEKYILEYKIIPEPILRIFTTFNLKNTSVIQRFDYWTDSAKIIQRNCLIGGGGNTWRVMYGQVQDYLYYAKEDHSYLLELFMSFGILGLVSFIFIIAITIMNAKDNLKDLKKGKNNFYNLWLSIIIGFSIIIIHSTMDFDMSYLIIEMITFIYIAILNKNDNLIKLKKGGLDILLSINFIIITIGNILGFSASTINDETYNIQSSIAPWIEKYKFNKIAYIENNKIENENIINYCKNYIKNEAYTDQNSIYEIICNHILNNIDKVDENKTLEEIDFLINTWKNVENERKYDSAKIQRRADIIIDFAENLNKKDDKLKQKAREIANIMIEKYKENNNIILNYTKNQEQEGIANLNYQSYYQTYLKALKIIE